MYTILLVLFVVLTSLAIISTAMWSINLVVLSFSLSSLPRPETTALCCRRWRRQLHVLRLFSCLPLSQLKMMFLVVSIAICYCL